MNEPPGADTFQNLSTAGVSGEELLRLHLQLTSLAVAQVTRRDIAEDIASSCLLELWKVFLPGDRLVSVEPFLLERLTKRIDHNRRKSEQQIVAEQQYIADCQSDRIHEYFILHTLNRVEQQLPLLELPEQQVLKSIIEDGLSLEQIAQQLEFPIPKVKRLYKHAVYRLRKELGLLKRYW